ncbi:DUF1320 domain-containing protein [Motilimonas sp. 1_MG-2023]|uniref:gp436 family protein n=1 Tax=Motilimonas sp. 1_MG-2023 TaxID=3062672 RepID=UPI0026E43309|nr:DUF1320 domain-containing protein [Motilimonas sp. 1_MG-2023]MDO6526944.1 DUF1320 domain-containing protein [Motilimonas sp. 1_MG-2023]
MYCTPADLIDAFGTDEMRMLTDETGSGEIDQAKLARVIADAGVRMNMYLAPWLPFAVVPEALKPLCADVSRYLLFDDVVPEQVKVRYEQAISYLKMVAKGDVRLVIDNTNTSSNDLAHIESAGTLLGRDQAKGFI